MPSMETSVALLVCHVKEADCPGCTVLGLTEIEAVGAGGGGGGGGGGGAAFFLQAPSMRRALRLSINTNYFILDCFTLAFLLRPQRCPRGQTKLCTISNSNWAANYDR